MCRLVNTIDGGLMKILSTKNRAAISQISSKTRMTPSRATPGRASIQRLKRWKKGGGASTRLLNSFGRGTACCAAQAQDHRVFRPRRRCHGRDGWRLRALRGLGQGETAAAAASRASIRATPSPTSISSSTAPRGAIGKSCTCTWRRRASWSPRRRPSIDLTRLATLPFVEQLDPAIKHRLITPADLARPKEPKTVYNQNPQRRWCEERPATICLHSTYKLEGRLADRHRARQQDPGRRPQEDLRHARIRRRAHDAVAGGGR